MKRKKALIKNIGLALVIVTSLLAIKESLCAQVTAQPAKGPGSTRATPAATPTEATKQSAMAHSPTPPKKMSVGKPMHYTPSGTSNRAKLYYDLIWGVDSLTVRYAESGEMIRFSYRVLDPAKAAALNDQHNEPSLIDPHARVKLVVPSLEKVGKLRQSSSAQAGKMYWMAFSNKGRLVKPGDRVNVVIGTFQAKGLIVE